MPNQRNQILDREAIQSKIKRIAFQILENNYQEEKLYIIGIEGGGAILAKKISQELESISQLKPIFLSVNIDKSSPSDSKVVLSEDVEIAKNAVVLLVDDVLNSGKTIFYTLRSLLDLNLSKIETAFLVNRAHRSFPIAANYTGIEIATTIQEHINFNWSEEGFGVYLE
ncbi:phosphoribosyltransferase family protein [Marivirga harenae]|uniref:phosphoribosyltransferase family protein n=1 Tax=Marivirga harenae TaxID=2010992 RepID=UPI0026DEB9E6|nr:phosphoribosyltransferase family protein [Marivirga harenae]WKV11506.1 phosphoribosyltransferase family protein [Marivirga harenae]|tara:strand:- start:83846 stop:84352 length:507 start_codon:yes stop_codon:yes gene_type:complete